MINFTAKSISTILHPLLVPTYGLVLLMTINTHSILAIPDNFRLGIIGFVFFTTFILPSLLIGILVKVGVASNFQMSAQRERVFPLLIVAIAFYLTYFFLKSAGLTGLITLFMVGSTMLVLITLLINYVTKISLHMIAWGGLLGCLLGFAIRFNYDLTLLIIATIMISGIVATARLQLNAHNPFQVYIGFLFGVAGMLGLFFIV
ncbi:MAG: hypothetical protein HN336_05475 [Lentimicrobiaceae bacterium]|jgi:hypothetical protein|nr:hypothetical protein [Lentimicrobiaceae bacterium]MCP4911320.1 hypothetical protein [Bacteroidota bacterium]MBT3454050.1 hypothetical protein [Lentimicrobiaceae bacterium]MBT3819168.1 hypothetical protein [Lentimicrobiaceae bacterium]MBT4060597.1 hypothetical protein [Lentimicrobiaceae bacterium]